jgi:regulator of protease activity HflC (stomatin/prohibitin superfamily)
MPNLILPLVIVALVIVLYLFFRRALFIVPQSQAVVIERLGKFNRVAYSGLNILIPFLESQRRIHYRVTQYDREGQEIGTQLMATPWIDMREKVLDFASQSVITKDNVVMSIDAVLYYRITDPVKVIYQVANFAEAIEKLTQTTLRNVVGELTLDETLASRETINARLRTTLDEVAERWGVQVTRVELQDISPPENIRETMELQMTAERKKRAVILTAEGEKEAAILQAEGIAQAKIREAEGMAQARLKIVQAEAEALEQIQQAVGGDQAAGYLVALKYLESLEKIADGQATKVFLPFEASGVLGSLGSMREIWNEASFRAEPIPKTKDND